jgi:hypothetical protein
MSAKLLRFNEAHIYQTWNTIPRDLKSEATRWVYLGPNGSRWDLEGRSAGRQGVRMNKELQGAHHLPFEHLLTESAYQVGATYERSNINKRIISLGVILGGPKYTSHAYRMIEANWWDAWPHDTPGWLGCHTKFGGWRWAQVQLAEAVKTAISTDPTAFENNIMHWDMKILAPKPWYAKRTLVETWAAHPDTVTANGFDEETCRHRQPRPSGAVAHLRRVRAGSGVGSGRDDGPHGRTARSVRRRRLRPRRHRPR